MLEIVEESIADLVRHAQISSAFRVESILEFEESADELTFAERAVEHPYAKDYDANELPSLLWGRFDGSNCGLLGAMLDGRRVGGIIIAPAMEVLARRPDVAVICDLRVDVAVRRRGVGGALFRAAEDWAASRHYLELWVETQNTNVPACRFYRLHGCALREVNPGAYPELPHEVQLIWSKVPKLL